MSKTNIEQEIVRLVRIERKKEGKTQREVAEALKVSAGFIGQVETVSHSSMYSYDQLNNLAKYLNCSLRTFMPENPI